MAQVFQNVFIVEGSLNFLNIDYNPLMIQGTFLNQGLSEDLGAFAALQITIMLWYLALTASEPGFACSGLSNCSAGNF